MRVVRRIDNQNHCIWVKSHKSAWQLIWGLLDKSHRVRLVTGGVAGARSNGGFILLADRINARSLQSYLSNRSFHEFCVECLQRWLVPSEKSAVTCSSLNRVHKINVKGRIARSPKRYGQSHVMNRLKLFILRRARQLIIGANLLSHRDERLVHRLSIRYLINCVRNCATNRLIRYCVARWVRRLLIIPSDSLSRLHALVRQTKVCDLSGQTRICDGYRKSDTFGVGDEGCPVECRNI